MPPSPANDSVVPPPPYILTLDIGTSSTRAMLFDAQAQAIDGFAAQVSYDDIALTDETPYARSRVDFDVRVFFQAAVQAIDEILEQAGPLAEGIGAVAMDTLVTNIVGVDAAGEAVTPLYTYAGTDGAAEAENLRWRLGPQGQRTVHNRTGCLVHAAYLPARFRWLAQAHPDFLQAAARWISIGEYLFWQFFGECAVSYSVASWTGLLNRQTLQWDQTWLEDLPIDEGNLSPLTDVDKPFSGLKEEWGSRWPSLKTVPWFPAIGDGAAANIGSGCDSPDTVALTIGTTGAMRVVVREAVETVPDGLWLYRVDRRRALLGGATTEGGNLFAWLQDYLQLPDEDDLEEALAARTPTAHGLTILPFVAGERAPGWNDDALASIIGFSLDTDAIDIVRAALEGIAYRFALIYQRIAPNLSTDHAHKIIASGGAILSSPVWLQIMADVLGQRILTSSEGEATSRGIALLALESLGVIAQTSDLPPATDTVYEPNPDHQQAYQAGLQRQSQLYSLLIN